jgi:hypothetical protein
MKGGGVKLIWLALVVVVIGATLLGQEEDSRAYDLDSAAPEGYGALRLLMEQSQVSVHRIDASEIDSPANKGTPNGAPAFDTVFVLDGSTTSAATLQRIRRFVESGGRVVVGGELDGIGAVADTAGGQPTSFVDPLNFNDALLPGSCDIDELADLRAVRSPWAPGFMRRSGTATCFEDAEDSGAVARTALGSGSIINISSPAFFVNLALGSPVPDQKKVKTIPDNAVLAQRVLFPDGVDSVAIVTSGVTATAGLGSQSVWSFMSAGVKIALLQALAAFVWFAWARGRRFGRVVRESVPVATESSDYVAAVGNLLARQHDASRAAATLRRAAEHDLRRSTGAPASMPPVQLAELVAARHSLNPADVVAALVSFPVNNDADLVALASSLEEIRQEAIRV